MRSLARTRRINSLTLYLFVLPVAVLWVLFILYPSLSNFYLCFFKFNGFPGNPMEYVGLRMFVKFFTWDWLHMGPALINGFKYAAIIPAIQNILGLFLAILLVKRIRLSNFFRAVYFLPVVLGPIVITMMWSLILDVRGILNAFLRNFGIAPIAWLAPNGHWGIWAVSMAMIWTYFGYSMVIFIAGLQGIDQQYYEAAKIDGADAWGLFRYVTLPMIMPAVTINLLLSLAGSLRMFDYPYLMGGNGGGINMPNYQTVTIPVSIFSAFNVNDYGYASAMQVILFFIVAVVTLIQTSITRRKEIEA